MTKRWVTGWRPFVGVGATGMALVCGVATASAQPLTNDPPMAPITIGPVYITPELALREIGVDSNVFNDDRELSDFTATVGADLEGVMLLGSGRVTGFMNTDYVWYQEFASERSINTTAGGQFEVFLAQMRPWVAASYLTTRERAGYEIDARARRNEPAYSGGVDASVGGRTTVAFSANRARTNFAAGEVFDDVPLDAVLNGTTLTYNLAYRMQVTPLTTWSVEGEYVTDRFDTVGDRDANSVRLFTRLLFDPDALIGGSALVGYRAYRPEDARLEPFNGLVAEAQLNYILI